MSPSRTNSVGRKQSRPLATQGIGSTVGRQVCPHEDDAWFGASTRLVPLCRSSIQLEELNTTVFEPQRPTVIAGSDRRDLLDSLEQCLTT